MKQWGLCRAKHLYAVIDERAGSRRPPMLAVSIHHGVVPRSDLTDDEPRADDLSLYKLCQPGDLVLNRMRAFQGAVGVASSAGLVSPEYLVLRPTTAEARFLHHLFRSNWFVGEMVARLRGIGSGETGTVRTPRINAEDLGEIVVRTPPLHEQQRIADFLDAETARVDSLIIRKRVLQGLLAERLDARIFRSVTRGLQCEPLKTSGLDWVDEIPQSWDTPTISANFELQLGKMLNEDAAIGPEQFPYLRNVNVHWDRFELEDLPAMHFSVTDRRRCELRSGDVLICEGGEVGRAAVWSEEIAECFFQKAIHRARPLHGANGRFLMYCLRAAAKRNLFAVEGNRSTIVHLTGEQLRVHRFPWPPAKEQVEIVECLDADAARAEATLDRLVRQIALLQERRQALITAAVTGELEIPGVAA